MINVGEGHWENNWICMETPVYWTSSGVLMIFPHTHHGIPPVYWTSIIALHTPGVLHRHYAGWKSRGGVLWKFLTGCSIFWISMTTCFRKFDRKNTLKFLANNNTMWCHFCPKFCTLILKFSYIFSNFANGNVNFSTFESIWLILTTSYVQRKNLDDFPAKYYPASEFFFKIDILLKGELQRQNKLISSERPFKILQNETKIIKIGHADLEIFNFKDWDLGDFTRKNDRKTENVVLLEVMQNLKNNRLCDVRNDKCTIQQ